MRDSNKVLLTSVVPPAITVALLFWTYMRGGIPAPGLLYVVSLYASIWLLAFAWGKLDGRIRKSRRTNRRLDAH